MLTVDVLLNCQENPDLVNGDPLVSRRACRAIETLENKTGRGISALSSPSRSPHVSSTNELISGAVIRLAVNDDWPEIWRMFQQVAAAGDVFAYDADTPEAAARQLWVEPPARAYVADRAGQILGTYFLRPNQPGRGKHVANAGYMVAPDSRGNGLASILCQHSLEVASSLGYRAMQFNFVIATNLAAIRVWRKHGFAIIGRLPKVFQHAQFGLVDALIMHREILAPETSG